MMGGNFGSAAGAFLLVPVVVAVLVIGIVIGIALGSGLVFLGSWLVSLVT